MNKHYMMMEFQFNKGMESDGMKFMNTEMKPMINKMGGLEIKVFQDEMNPMIHMMMIHWNNMAKMKQFKMEWMKMEHKFKKHCSHMGEMEMYKNEMVA